MSIITKFFPGDDTTNTRSGMLRVDPSHRTWAASIGASAAQQDVPSFVTLGEWGIYSDNTYQYFGRGYLLFDTSSLPDSHKILAADVAIYVTVSQDPYNDNHSFNLFQLSPASQSAIALGDFDAFGTTALATEIAEADITTSAYNKFSLNSSGLALISKTSGTNFAVRTSPDYDDDAPYTGATDYIYTRGKSSSESGTSLDPYLEVTHCEDLANDWDGYEKMTIDNTKVSGSENIDDFPVLIKDGNLPSAVYSGLDSSTGDDLRFSTDADGEEQIPFEIVSIDTSAEECQIWVKIPELSYNADTEIYAWYGNSSASAYDDDDEFGSQEVWTNEFMAVWHMEEQSGTRYDSTANGNHLSSVNGVGYAAAKFGTNAADFELSSSQYLERANDASMYSADEISWSAWAKEETIGGLQVIMGTYRSGSDNGTMFAVAGDTLRTWIAQGITDSENMTSTDDLGLVTGTYKHVYGTWESTTKKLDYYSDGVKLGDTLTGTKTVYDDNNKFGVGAYAADDSGLGFFDGVLDEVRLHSAKRSAGWVGTEYNNQNAPDTFWKAGSTPAASDDPIWFGMSF